MDALNLIKLKKIMDKTSGNPALRIALVDGPVNTNHPDFKASNIEIVPGSQASCQRFDSEACAHGTFIAGILCGKRGSISPSICPSCTLLIRTIFPETPKGQMPSATPIELADAIIECIREGAMVINLSIGLTQTSSKGLNYLRNAIDYSSKRGVIIVVASGNQRIIGGTSLTNHPGVIPVVGCDSTGRPLNMSNLGRSIGKNGLMAPGENITSLGSGGRPVTMTGTSAAAPFVTGAIALLWSAFPNKSPIDIKSAITQENYPQRKAIVPPLLNACTSYKKLKLLSSNNGG